MNWFYLKFAVREAFLIFYRQVKLFQHIKTIFT